MNDYNKDKEDKYSYCCYFHPKQVLIGVCPLCLNERLLILASKQGLLPKLSSHSLPKIFAFGNSLLNIFEFQHKPQFLVNFDSVVSASPEDNGTASWEKSKVSKLPSDHCSSISWNQSLSTKTKSVVEHAKPHGSLRWRKRIGHLFQLSRWRRSNKGSSVCHVGSKVEGVKVRSGWWIRALTKRRRAKV